MQLLRHLSLIGIVASLTTLTHLGSAKLWDRDEPRNARCAWEMLERGDWVVPTFNNELRTHKPVLLYWMMMSSYTVFGINEFSARFASAALAVGTVLLTYGIGRRLFDSVTALWSAVILSSTLMFNVAARAATPDSTLIFFGTLSLYFFVHAIPQSVWQSDRRADQLAVRSVWIALGIYTAMGMGVLAKGPVGFVLPAATIGTFLLVARPPSVMTNVVTQAPLWKFAFQLQSRLRPRHIASTGWAMRPCLALFVVTIVALPWYYAVGVRTDGEWLRGFFFEHNLSRAMQPMEGHRGSFLFYPVALLCGFFPWSVLAVPTGQWAYTLYHRVDSKRPTLLLLCWCAVYVAVFSVAQTKLPSYITPIYPAVAILVGRFVKHWLESYGDRQDAIGWIPIAACCLMMVGIVLTVTVPIAAHALLPGEEWLGMIGGIPLLTGLLVFHAARSQNHRLSASALATGSVCFIVVLFAYGAPRISHHQQIERLLTSAESVPSESLATYAAHEPSWVFYAGRSLKFFRVGEQARALNHLQSMPSAGLITTRNRLNELQRELPSSVTIVDRVPYFLEDEELVLLRRTSPRVGDASAHPSRVSR